MIEPPKVRFLAVPHCVLAVATCLVLVLTAGAAPARAAEASGYGISAFATSAKDVAGNDDTQAAGHPVIATTSFRFNTEGTGGAEEPIEDAKEINTFLPPGFIGNPQATPRCQSMSLVALFEPQCPVDTAVGYVVVTDNGGFELRPVPIYNVVPQRGEPALFAFPQSGPQFTISGKLEPTGQDADGGYRISLDALAPQTPKVIGVSATFCGYGVEKGGSVFLPTLACRLPSDPAANAVPLLTNPSDCSAGPPATGLEVNTWQHPELTYERDAFATEPPSPVTGCGKLIFEPTIQVAPSTSQADSPSGYAVDLRIPESEGRDALGTPPLKTAVVTLPSGVGLNAAGASGLQGCTDAQFGENDELPANCPEASTVGTIEAATPVLDHNLSGSVYLRQPDPGATRANGLFTIFLDIEDPATGTIVKLRGQVVPDSTTGQLTATFVNNPQLPVSDLKLNFKGGAQAPLATPATCGAFDTTTRLEPWSSPQTPSASPGSQFSVNSGPNGQGCVATPQQRSFAPGLSAGSVSVLSGSPSTFNLRLTRNDGEQEISTIQATLPVGFTAKLAGVPYCSDAAIAAASHASGKTEQASPSCPAASQIGTLETGAGAGPSPYYVSGKAYLAGPFKGAPLSMVFITPAVAGPFDLGNVVVRAALLVNPETAQVTVKSDPIPQILEGVPLRLRDVRVHIDRPDFTLNPTNCSPSAVVTSIGGASGATATPSNPFQVGECAALDFAPKLAVSIKGGHKRGAFQQLKAVLTQPAGQANIAKVSVALPHSEFLEQGHIRTICTRVQFNAGAGNGAGCPKGSIYGRARAVTPLLDQPLEGPVYLRSSSHKLPDLVAALHGQIDIDLDGRIDSVHGGIRNSFEMVPDAPVSKFVLEMKGGKKSLLVNSRNICNSSPKVAVKMEGQNGKRNDSSIPLATTCGKKSKKPKKK